MLKAILFDLDDTLLTNDMMTFIPAYFQALSAAFASVLDPELLLSGMLEGTQAMDGNDGTGPTNRQAFEAVFYRAVKRPQSVLEPVFERFYAAAYPGLRALTRKRPLARTLVELGLSRGWQVVIATNPVFPRTAIEQRLDWAGISASEIPYALITSFEDMHATKAHPAYYREILQRLGRAPQECLMVGDDPERDMAPAAQEGISGFRVFASDEGGRDKEALSPDPAASPGSFGAGTLRLLLVRLRALSG